MKLNLRKMNTDLVIFYPLRQKKGKKGMNHLALMGWGIPPYSGSTTEEKKLLMTSLK